MTASGHPIATSAQPPVTAPTPDESAAPSPSSGAQTTVDLNDEPRFRQIARDLRGRITAGEFPAGSVLPSEREVAHSYAVARPTAARAMQVLRLEGWAYTRRGSGTFARVPQEPDFSGATSAGDDEQVMVTILGQPPQDIAEILCLPVEAIMGRRTLQRDERGVRQITSIWFPQHAAEVNPELQEKSGLSVPDADAVQQALGLRAERIQDSVTAQVASASAQRLFAPHAGRNGAKSDIGANVEADPDVQPIVVLQQRRIWVGPSNRILAVADIATAPRGTPLTWETWLT